ncbi:unnamed protein product [Somion occarium]|uniref:glutathione transferase n=1 Tax=Somion occarium TaxID=3059160 RepID=A0ABP1DBN4_9APHY
MTIQLHGAAGTTCTNRVFLVAKELNIPVVLVPVDFATAEHKSEAYLEHQPFGQVPYIVDNANVQQYGGNSGLIPKDPKKLAKFEQAASIEVTDFDPHAGAIMEKVFKAFRGLPADETIVAKHAELLIDKLDAYERILKTSKWLAGGDLTLADLLHLPYGDYLTKGGYGGLLEDEEKRPHVAKKSPISRPTWQAVQNGA